MVSCDSRRSVYAAWRADLWQIRVRCVAVKILSVVLSKVAGMWLFQNTCVVCNEPASGVCGACVDQLAPPEVPPLLAVDTATVLCSYEGVGAELVTAIKYENRRQALSPLVDALAATLHSNFDAVVAVPSHPVRRRERGFDVPELIAKRLSKRLGVPVARPLTRVDNGAQQGRGRAERQGVEFRASDRVPERILLVDDVVTTGATAVACALTLGLAGARSTSFVALAATPAPNAATPALSS